MKLQVETPSTLVNLSDWQDETRIVEHDEHDCSHECQSQEVQLWRLLIQYAHRGPMWHILQFGSVEVGQSICGSCQECHGQSSRGSGPSKERLGGCEGNCSEDGGNMQMQRQKAACEDHH